MAIPEVTRLPRGVRRTIRRRSERQARQIYGPDIRQARRGVRTVKRQYRGQRKQIQRTYRQDVRSTRQAVKGFSKILSSAQRQSANPKFGLTGQYRQEVAQDFATRRADIASSLPTLTADARQTRAASLASLRQSRASDVASARSDIQTARSNLTAEEARRYASAATSARLHLVSQRKSRQSASQTTGTGRKSDIGKALKIGQLMLQTTPSNKLPWAEKSLKHYGSAEGAWAGFTRELLAQEGVTDPGVATSAASILRRQYEYAVHNPGTGLARRYRTPRAG